MNRLLVASAAFALLTTLGIATAQEGSSFRMQLSAPILFSQDGDSELPPGGGTSNQALISFPASYQLDAYVGGSVSLDLATLAVLPEGADFSINDVSWSMTAPLAIPGITLSPNGVLSGSPVDDTDHDVLISATHPDAQGAFAFRLEIGPALEADAANIIAAMTVPPSADRRDLIEALVADLKAGGVWDELDVLYVMAAHDEQAARINWKSPSLHALTVTSGVMFRADEGFENPATGYGWITSSWAPTDGPNWALGDGHVGGWNYDGGYAYSFVRSASDANYQTNLTMAGAGHASSTARFLINANTVLNPSNPGSAQGYWLGNRNGNSFMLRLNGAHLGNVSAAPKGVSSAPLAILSGNNSVETTASIVHLGGYLDTTKSTAANASFQSYMAGLQD